jgi:tetratricopeptide (TPR) repeat protein
MKRKHWRATIGSWLVAIVWLALPPVGRATTNDLFLDGVNAYDAGQFVAAARSFRESAALAPAAGTLLNLGLSEWRRNRPGAAIRAWEQVLWLSPHNPAATASLAYARRLLDAPSPTWRWYERVSAWLPPDAWAWTTTAGLWLIIAAVLLPDILRRRRSATSQAFAALGLMILLLSLPAQLGMATRRDVGFVLLREATLRLTPTTDSETVAKLPAGEPARQLRARGDYVLVKTAQGQGWLERRQFGLIVPR